MSIGNKRAFNIVDVFQLKTFENMPIIMFEITYFIAYRQKGGI